MQHTGRKLPRASTASHEDRGYKNSTSRYRPYRSRYSAKHKYGDISGTLAVA